MSGERPNFWKDPATEASPLKFPNESDKPENPPNPLLAGAAFSKPSMPGTAAATLPNSAAVRRVLARPNRAPDPPLACAGVMESSFVSRPTRSGLALLTMLLAAVRVELMGTGNTWNWARQPL